VTVRPPAVTSRSLRRRLHLHHAMLRGVQDNLRRFRTAVRPPIQVLLRGDPRIREGGISRLGVTAFFLESYRPACGSPFTAPWGERGSNLLYSPFVRSRRKLRRRRCRTRSSDLPGCRCRSRGASIPPRRCRFARERSARVRRLPFRLLFDRGQHVYSATPWVRDRSLRLGNLVRGSIPGRDWTAIRSDSIITTAKP